MATPITKAAWQVLSPDEIPDRLAEAFALAVSGRPGPVLLDIPMDVQGAMIDRRWVDRPRKRATTVDDSAVDELLAALARAERPLILAGRRHSLERLGTGAAGTARGAGRAGRRLAARHRRPSLRRSAAHRDDRELRQSLGEPARSAMPTSCSCSAAGSTSARPAPTPRSSRAIGRSSTSTARRVRSTTGSMAVAVWSETCAPSSRRSGRAAASRSRGPSGRRSSRQARALWPDTDELRDIAGINPNVLMHALSSASGAAGAFVADVGQHQMWAAQSLELSGTQRFMTSGGMGAMGSALPLAIGIAIVDPRPVVLIAGDGGFQTNIQELETVVRNGLPLKMVIVNNHCHGMVRQFQESYFEGRYPSTVLGLQRTVVHGGRRRLRDLREGRRRGGRARRRAPVAVGGPRRAGAARGDGRHARKRVSQARVRQADHRDGAVRQADRDGRHLAMQRHA